MGREALSVHCPKNKVRRRRTALWWTLSIEERGEEGSDDELFELDLLDRDVKETLMKTGFFRVGKRRDVVS
jgi:hypothetical protein